MSGTSVHIWIVFDNMLHPKSCLKELFWNLYDSNNMKEKEREALRRFFIFMLCLVLKSIIFYGIGTIVMYNNIRTTRLIFLNVEVSI